MFCVDTKATLLAITNSDQTLSLKLSAWFIVYWQRILLSIFCWVHSHCGLFGNEWADRIAKNGAFENTLSHIDIPLFTREMFNILENRMKTDLNLLNSYYLKGPIHIFSLIYRLSVHGLKTKYCKDGTCTCRGKISITHFLFNCQTAFRNSDLSSNSTIHTSPTDVLYNPQYFVPLAHLFLKSPIGPLI